MNEATARRVVVVGAGISGLAAAWRLSRRSPGTEVIVLEGAPEVGGKLRVAEIGGLTVDVGAESVLARRPEAVALIAEAGLGDDLVHPVPTATASVLARGRLHRLPAGTVMGVPGSLAVLPGLAGLLTTAEVDRVAAEPTIDAPAVVEDVDVASWVAGRMGRAVVDRLVEPLLGGVYAGHADQLSLAATVPALWQRAHHGGAHDRPDDGGGADEAGLERCGRPVDHDQGQRDAHDEEVEAVEHDAERGEQPHPLVRLAELQPVDQARDGGVRHGRILPVEAERPPPEG